LAQDHTTALQSIGKDGVVTGKSFEFVKNFGAKAPACGALRHEVGRKTVLFSKHDIETDRERARLHQEVHHLREVIARPWPLADLGETRFVDVDDDDRAVVALWGRPWDLLLVEIKQCVP